MIKEPKKTERRLLVLRHAKSSWSQPEQADIDRALNERGRAAAKLMGKKMREEGLSVDMVLASPATRVRETLEILLPAWHWDGPIVWGKQLYLASRETILAQIGSLSNDWQSVLVVGHNPGLSDLVSYLTDHATDMPTCALAVLSIDQDDWLIAARHRPWRKLAYFKPKELE